MKRAYPVIFTQAEDVVLVEVPDMEILTEGKNIEDAIDMARDAIGIAGISREDAEETIPAASFIHEINIEQGTFSKDGESFVSMVDVDFTIYRRRLDKRAVRKNVTIPNWLNKEAEKSGLNISRVLQEALIETLGLQGSTKHT